MTNNTTITTPGQLRQHARLLRDRYADHYGRDGEAARAQADLMLAQAELLEAQADQQSPAPEEDCTICNLYPIIGKITRRGGAIIEVDHPWTTAHGDALRQRGVDMAFEWCHDPRAGIDQGELIRIYIGTSDAGPLVMWCGGKWTSHTSKGNFGKNWACGGNWSSVGGKNGEALQDVAPDLATIIEDAKMDIDRVKKAEARVKAANKRILACSQRDMAASATRQASHPAYPGQDIICLGRADMALACAARTEAEAELIEAQAGL